MRFNLEYVRQRDEFWTSAHLETRPSTTIDASTHDIKVIFSFIGIRAADGGLRSRGVGSDKECYWDDSDLRRILVALFFRNDDVKPNTFVARLSDVGLRLQALGRAQQSGTGLGPLLGTPAHIFV
ncbi:hypothetical protein PanWU01x14_309300 [Parasponia andersonii]|uniref:Uncharacterized protein n=1 Tax=Parasponia andersonii TaxID=3476 RepID=A0A2P5AQU1_PARAD|nr:hypothetical protein PanWU01x14_309300 [Parasponia andersonii]